MGHLFGLIHLSVLLATFLPAFLSQFDNNDIDSDFDDNRIVSEFGDTKIDMGSCRRECLELNQNTIVRAHHKDNSILVGLCYNVTKLRSDHFSSYNLQLPEEAQSIIISYICDRETGIWKYDRKVCPINEFLFFNCNIVALIFIQKLRKEKYKMH
ncbi:unnamed protein product [Onchocerca flexuosa]|uniref:Apple domain-containing protein n=1 Tax=Onchocerca flexuosa TaxID=387005 RepID=A0A183HS70_9BILA|nr:unnamed protein product [Onchocerca flexuosa]